MKLSRWGDEAFGSVVKGCVLRFHRCLPLALAIAATCMSARSFPVAGFTVIRRTEANRNGKTESRNGDDEKKGTE